MVPGSKLPTPTHQGFCMSIPPPPPVAAEPITACRIMPPMPPFVCVVSFLRVPWSPSERLLWRFVRRFIRSDRCDLCRWIDDVEDESCDDGGSEVRDQINPDIVPA